MNKRHKKIGLPPGSVIFTGNKKIDTVQIHYMQYGTEQLTEKNLDTRKAIIFPPSPDDKVDWYDIRGIHDTALIEFIGNTFNIHNLILEDVSDINQRAKFEEYEDGIFILVKALHFDAATTKISTEQVAIFFRKGFIATFQETESDLFAMVRRRIQSGRGKIKQRGTDYLAYALIDVLADNYFLVLEEIQNKIEQLEEQLMDTPESSHKSDIHKLKKELLEARKAISPLREAIGQFSRAENNLVSDDTFIFIRDLYDHIIQAMEMLESFRDLLNGISDLFISELSFKMNRVMQLLTIVATIFIPLTFLAGIYGMNFDYMPELKFKYSYFIFWGVMAAIFAGLIYFFRKKKWL